MCLFVVCCMYTSAVVLDALWASWPLGASRPNFCGLGLGLENCTDNFFGITLKLKQNNKLIIVMIIIIYM